MPSPEFIMVSTDLTTPNEALLSLKGQMRQGGVRMRTGVMEASAVRRPLRGIQLKQETFATLSIYDVSKSPVIHNSSAKEMDSVNYTSNFILQSVNESRSEKFQPITTFGAAYGFFFGEQPRMMSFSAILLNTADFQWEIEWWANYEEFMRGTRLADRQVRAYLTYEDVIIEGYIVSAVTSKNAQTPHEVGLNFSMWVTGVEYLVEPGDTAFPTSPEAAVIDFTGETELVQEINSVYPSVSTTSEVRARNIAAISEQGTGLLAQLRATLADAQDFVGRVGQTLDNAKNFLYGRNLVIPSGFAGSESNSGKSSFVDSSGNVVILSGVSQSTLLQTVGGLNIRMPVNLSSVGSPKARGKFYDNVDEYPFRSGQQNYDMASDAFKAAADAAGVVGGTGVWADLSPLGSAQWPSSEDVDAMATKAAEDAFAEFGIKVNNMDGKSTSELSRALGQVAFGAINLGASALGASQAAASLTVGNVVGGTTQMQSGEVGMIANPPVRPA